MVTKYLKLSDNSRIAYMQRIPNARQEASPSLLYLGGLSSSMHGTKVNLIDKWAEQNGIAMTCFDYRGHGESSGEFTDFGIDHWAQDAITVVDQLISGKIIVIGSSLGGWIGALLAKARPERFAGFIGIASAPDFTETSFRKKLNSQQLEKLANGQNVELPSGYPEPYQISPALMDGGKKYQVLNSEIAMPFAVRLFQGMNDGSVPVEQAIQFARAIQSEDLELNIVKAADHGFSRENDLEKIFTAILEILEKRTDHN